MNFIVNFKARDFSAPIFPGLKITPLSFSWSAFGGPDEALLRFDGRRGRLMESVGMLRCGVEICDPYGIPVWWGYIDQITVFLEGARFTVSLEDIYNRVSVTYSFISPDNKLADQLETADAQNTASQVEYGIKQVVLHEHNLDDSFAESLRDTFLDLHAWPSSLLSEKGDNSEIYAQLHCSGWFSTLNWLIYENTQGFYANYGPGAGTLNFGFATARYPAQKFTPGASVSAKYAYFRLRKNLAPTGNAFCRIYSDAAGSPNAVLATSQAVACSSLPATSYSWTRFTFTTAYSLIGATPYWIACYRGVSDAVNNLYIKTDEDANYYQEAHFAKYWDGAAWVTIPNMTSPGTNPDLMFRLVCISDSGSQISNMASVGNQFFDLITSLTTGVNISPYRSGQNTCLAEILKNMALGTSNQRMILAKVSSQRRLVFYEQPDPTPTAFMDRYGHLFSQEGVPIPAYRPPVGQYVHLSGSNYLTMPFDARRVPSCFVQSAEYNCITGEVEVNGRRPG